MTRKIHDTWLNEYLRFTEGQESPSMFHMWVGISVIASTLERSVFLDRGYYTLYPNMYIILVADSAICKKTTATNIGIKLLENIHNPPAIFSQKITPEALISAVCNECAMDEEGAIFKNAAAVVYGPELSVFLGKEAYSSGMVSILTSLYDCPDMWEYETIGRGKDIAYNTCVNMLGASTPEWLRLSIPPDAVGGGFTSRIIFVYQHSSDKIIAHPEVTQQEIQERENLIEDLSAIREIHGQFKFTPTAKDWYTKWYHMHRKAQIAGDDYTVRKEDTVLKLAMCFSASKGDSLLITEEFLEQAVAALDANELFLPEAMRILSSTAIGVDANKVAVIIQKYPDGIKHDELVRRTMYSIDKTKLTEIIETLAAAKVIEVAILTDTNERVYTYKDIPKKIHFADKFKSPLAEVGGGEK